jgi:hypothetical protein
LGGAIDKVDKLVEKTHGVFGATSLFEVYDLDRQMATELEIFWKQKIIYTAPFLAIFLDLIKLTLTGTRLCCTMLRKINLGKGNLYWMTSLLNTGQVTFTEPC